MICAFVRKPFQKPAVVVGNLDASTSRLLDDKSLPRDIPDDWHTRHEFKVYSYFPLHKGLFATSIVTRGEDDEFGRPNLVSHILVSDSHDIRFCPVFSIRWLEKALSSKKLPSEGEVQTFIEEIPKTYDTEVWSSTKKSLIADYPESFLSAALSAISANRATYVIYSDSRKLLDFVSFVSVSMGAIIGENNSFDSECGSGFSTDSISRLRGIRTGSGRLDLEKRAISLMKSQRACAIDLLERRIVPEDKQDISYVHLTKGTLGPSWFGIPASTQVRAIQTITRGQVSHLAQMKGLDKHLDKTLADIEAIEALVKRFRR